jgi:hypothetical protein
MAGKSIVLVKNTLDKGLKTYFGKVDTVTPLALGKGGLQLLNNTITGSPAAKAIPPKLTGHLRGSGSVFVGNKLVGDTQASESSGTPNKDHSDDPNVITVGFDTPYAAKMHEHIGIDYKLGPESEKSGNVEAFFLRKHIEGDKDEIMQLIATFIKQETGS